MMSISTPQKLVAHGVVMMPQPCAYILWPSLMREHSLRGAGGAGLRAAFGLAEAASPQGSILHVSLNGSFCTGTVDYLITHTNGTAKS